MPKMKTISEMTPDEAADYVEALDPDTIETKDATPLRLIVAASGAVDAAETNLAAAVAAARAANMSWTSIGAVLGVSRQAAQQRFGA